VFTLFNLITWKTSPAQFFYFEHMFIWTQFILFKVVHYKIIGRSYIMDWIKNKCKRKQCLGNGKFLDSIIKFGLPGQS